MLAREANGVLALLGETGVIDDPPTAPGEVHLRDDPLADSAQPLHVGPVSLGQSIGVLLD